jgi:hypothetical protein
MLRAAIICSDFKVWLSTVGTEHFACSWRRHRDPGSRSFCNSRSHCLQPVLRRLAEERREVHLDVFLKRARGQASRVFFTQNSSDERGFAFAIQLALPLPEAFAVSARTHEMLVSMTQRPWGTAVEAQVILGKLRGAGVHTPTSVL